MQQNLSAFEGTPSLMTISFFLLSDALELADMDQSFCATPAQLSNTLRHDAEVGFCMFGVSV